MQSSSASRRDDRHHDDGVLPSWNETAKPWTSIPQTQRIDSGGFAAAQVLGLINAAQTSDKELESLLSERQRLLDLKFSGNATRKELVRLEYVRWSLDRIEVARFGSFGALEDTIRQYEQFAHDLEQLNLSLDKAKKSRSR